MGYKLILKKLSILNMINRIHNKTFMPATYKCNSQAVPLNDSEALKTELMKSSFQFRLKSHLKSTVCQISVRIILCT